MAMPKADGIAEHMMKEIVGECHASDLYSAGAPRRDFARHVLGLRADAVKVSTDTTLSEQKSGEKA